MLRYLKFCEVWIDWSPPLDLNPISFFLWVYLKTKMFINMYQRTSLSWMKQWVSFKNSFFLLFHWNKLLWKWKKMFFIIYYWTPYTRCSRILKVNTILQISRDSITWLKKYFFLIFKTRSFEVGATFVNFITSKWHRLLNVSHKRLWTWLCFKNDNRPNSRSDTIFYFIIVINLLIEKTRFYILYLKINKRFRLNGNKNSYCSRSSGIKVNIAVLAKLELKARFVAYLLFLNYCMYLQFWTFIER